MVKYALILKNWYGMKNVLNYILSENVFDTEEEAIKQHYYCSDWLLIKGDFSTLQSKHVKGGKIVTFYTLKILHSIKSNEIEN